MASAFISNLLAPRVGGFADDWLDKRAGMERMEREERIERHRAFTQEWLRKNHPRFGGREAQ